MSQKKKGLTRKPKDFNSGPMISNPLTYKEILNAAELTRRKNQDYTGGLGEFFNFEFGGQLADSLVNKNSKPKDRSIANLIGTKIARLIALAQNVSKPNFESIADTKVDIANYFFIWAAMDKSKRRK